MATSCAEGKPCWARAFAAPSTNPFGLVGVGGGDYASLAAFADIDGDGDLDAFIGNNYDQTTFFLNTGTAIGNMVHGPEYLARVTTYAPDGSVHSGSSQVELFINGAYAPYGFA